MSRCGVKDQLYGLWCHCAFYQAIEHWRQHRMCAVTSDCSAGERLTSKSGVGRIVIMPVMAFSPDGPTLSLSTRRGTSTACASCMRAVRLQTGQTCSLLGYTHSTCCSLQFTSCHRSALQFHDGWPKVQHGVRCWQPMAPRTHLVEGLRKQGQQIRAGNHSGQAAQSPGKAGGRVDQHEALHELGRRCCHPQPQAAPEGLGHNGHLQTT